MNNHKADNSPKFGTFKGVYLPSLLTILGVILYLRLGWIVGNVGIFKTVVIVTLSSLITFLTALSIAATATNMKVGAGGAYYMISRSLGIEAGAAIGLPLFLAQALGIAFYITGFTESIQSMLPWISGPILGSVTLIVLSVIAYRSTNAALRMQLVIFTLIALSLFSFFLGGPPEEGFQPVTNLPPPESFWVVFAVFFPAVTGILAGVALSGNLKNPARSIPIGTIGAIVTGYVIYLSIPIMLFFWVPEDILRTNLTIIGDVAKFESLIVMGLWGAALSSALGSLLGAPRTLQALARDRVVPQFLGRGAGEDDTPRVATLVSFAIGLTGIWMGDLNAIASVLSMFFLTTYGLLNLAAGLETLIGNPSWRPTFRVHWGVSLAGALGCLGVMFMIDAGATIVAITIGACIYFIMEKRRLNRRWEDIRQGIWMFLARTAIYQLNSSPSPIRSWRPNLLVFSGIPRKRWYLVELADAITHGKGFLTFCMFLPKKEATQKQITEKENILQDYLHRHYIPALVEVHPAHDILAEAAEMIQHYGIGGLVPNTIMLGETEEETHYEKYAQLIRKTFSLQRNLIIVRESQYCPLPQHPKKNTPKIDVWWGRKKQNAGFMLAIAYMLQNSPEWQGAVITLRTIVSREEEQEGAEQHLEEFLSQGRIKAKVEIIRKKPTEKIFDLIRQHSSQSHLILLGVRPPEPEETSEQYSQYYQTLLDQTSGLPLVCFVLVAEEHPFLEIFV